MVDPETVSRRLRELDRRLGLLRGIRGLGRAAFLADEGLQAQAERHLQLAIQSVIDVALHIVAEDAAATPEDYGSTFVILADELRVLDVDLAARLRSAAGLRNLLVHGYLDIDPGQVWSHLEQLDDLEAFASAVQAWQSAP